VIVTTANPDWPASSTLVAVIWIEFGVGVATGAVKRPVASIEPQLSGFVAPAPETDQVTCWSAVPVTLAENRNCSVVATPMLPG